MDVADLLDRLIFIGGPPRSGTTFAARCLNLHPRLMTAIDDHVYESWSLYHYPTRTGIVERLRREPADGLREAVRDSLARTLAEGGSLRGVAPSPKTAGCAPAPFAPLTAGSSAVPLNLNLERYAFPLSRFEDDWRLCLKSPEISFVLPALASCFPEAKFVIVYRPLREIAESMYRSGQTVKRVPVFHARWKDETDGRGRVVPPPGVPAGWDEPWRRASGFQRCVIYAASYLSRLALDAPRLPRERRLAYDHARLRREPVETLRRLANFLGVEEAGFDAARSQLKPSVPSLDSGLDAEYSEVVGGLGAVLKDRESLDRLL
jgi:hypothetical protein